MCRARLGSEAPGLEKSRGLEGSAYTDGISVYYATTLHVTIYKAHGQLGIPHTCPPSNLNGALQSAPQQVPPALHVITQHAHVEGRDRTGVEGTNAPAGDGGLFNRRLGVTCARKPSLAGGVFSVGGAKGGGSRSLVGG